MNVYAAPISMDSANAHERLSVQKNLVSDLDMRGFQIVRDVRDVWNDEAVEDIDVFVADITPGLAKPALADAQKYDQDGSAYDAKLLENRFMALAQTAGKHALFVAVAPTAVPPFMAVDETFGGEGKVWRATVASGVQAQLASWQFARQVLRRHGSV